MNSLFRDGVDISYMTCAKQDGRALPVRTKILKNLHRLIYSGSSTPKFPDLLVYVAVLAYYEHSSCAPDVIIHVLDRMDEWIPPPPYPAG